MNKQEIESYWNSHSHTPEDRPVDIMYKEDFIEFALWMQSQHSGMRWVRASERLPPISRNEIPMKYKGKVYIGQNLYGRYLNFPFGAVGIDYDSKLVPKQLEDVEWLAESPSPDIERIRQEHGEMKQALQNIIHTCGTINMSSFEQMKDAINGTLEISESLIQKIEANGK